MSHSLTVEQDAILLAAQGKDNLILNALAGAGKTSTLELIDRATRTKPCLYLVFNSKNAKEATLRMSSTTTVRTFNSIGHRIWASAISGNVDLDSRKSSRILRALINEAPKATQSPMWESYHLVINSVDRAKALGYIPPSHDRASHSLLKPSAFHARLEETPDDLTCDLIDAVLLRSILEAHKGKIDFNDQIYMPALFGGTYPKFPLTLADEAQDLNPVNHLLLRKLVGDRRLIAVGDPNQSIYAFRGAVESGMSSMQRDFSCTPLDLSVSFRCPQAIVEASRWHVPHFKWLKTGGHVETLTTLDLSSIDASAVFICRNNAPLFGLALRLLGAGLSISLSGSDIGPKLIGIMQRMGGKEDLERKAFVAEIDAWEEDKLAAESTSATDLAACMRLFARVTGSKSGAVSYVEHIFAQTGSIRLMTGHKAKGLEFPLVYHLDPHLCKNTPQDNNLRYVIGTRSMSHLYEISSTDLRP